MNIRNFAIIAHIDHGKSTLADRLLEITGSVKAGSGAQLLDTMDLEKEKGITIKLNPARMSYEQGGVLYQLNLIDTPGHVDFGYEVSRSLDAVEGVLLLVDASQGVQAQTLTNLTVAQQLGLVIIPVVNKIDLPTAQVPETISQLRKLLSCEESEICLVSGKTGEGVGHILQAVIERIPPPDSGANQPLQALVFDSFFDKFLGVVAYVKIENGHLAKQQRVTLKATGATFDVIQSGYLQISRHETPGLNAGEIGYVATGLKSVQDCRVGDTIVVINDSTTPALPGYKTPKPMIYASFFPEPGKERELTTALGKLKLNDASLTYDPVSSQALGPGYNIGFLGLLHMEIIKERLLREYDVNVLVTTPSVAYRQTPEGWQEPWVHLEVVAPQQYFGAVSDLAANSRAEFVSVDYVGEKAVCRYAAPLSEVIIDFYDTLKSVTSGYASMDYQLDDYRAADLVAVDLLIAGDKIDALTQHMVRSKAERYGRRVVERLKELIPRQNFEISIQAAIGGKIIARADISAFRKDVTAKLYGGDVTRKNKLLDKQKKGKKRLRKLGRIDVPSGVFVELLKK